MAREITNATIKIFDRYYNIRTTEDLNYLFRLVDELNQRIKSFEGGPERYSDMQTLSMVALQILDEKSKIEKEYNRMKDIAKRIELGSNKV